MSRTIVSIPDVARYFHRPRVQTRVQTLRRLPTVATLDLRVPELNISRDSWSKMEPHKPVNHQDGFEISFVKQPPQEIQLECPICLQLLNNPCLLDCECGNCFCKECIESIKKSGNPCPLCNQQFSIVFPNKKLKRTLNGLHIHCPHEDNDGCAWTDEIGKLAEHFNRSPKKETRLDGCRFVYVLCTFCNFSFLRKEIREHEASLCPKRPFTCQYCGHSSVLNDIMEKHWPRCLKFPLPCPFECGQYPQRKNLKHHVASKCELALVECEFDWAGCEAVLPRKDIPAHQIETIVKHSSLLATKHKEIIKDVEACKKDNAEMKVWLHCKVEEIHSTEKPLLSQIGLLKNENKSLKTNFRNRIAALKKENLSLQQNLTQTNKKLECLKSKVQLLDSQMTKLHSQPRSESASPFEPNARQPPPTLTPTVTPPLSSVATSTLPLAELTMKNVQRMLSNRHTWNSAPFYSAEGYRMLLNAKPDKTHLSVYVYIIKGEHDGKLEWPFRGEVTVTLLGDHIGDDDITESAEYNDACGDCGNRRQSFKLVGGYGWPSFIELKYLTPKYVKNDSLTFLIENVCRL